TKPLPRPIYLLNADGTHNSHGKVSRQYQADVTMEAGWRGELPLLVTELNDGEIVLGADWLVKANPIIDWKNLTITYPSNLRLIKEAPLVPTHYHEYLDVFSEEEAMRMPKRKKWDMPIDLEIPKEEYQKKIGKGGIYAMTREERLELKEWIDEQLSKGYIRPSRSEIAASVFFIPKKGGKK